MRFRRAVTSASVVAALAAFVAAGAPAHAGEYGHAVVPTQVIYPGETIDPAKLQLVEVTNPNLAPGYATTLEEVAGLVTTRTLLPGRTISAGALRQPFAVKRGSTVLLVYDHGGLRITATGTPLQDASIGDMIKLRNVDTGVIISGTVMGDGTILVAQK